MAFTAGAEVGFAALLRPIMDKGFVNPDPDFIKLVPLFLILVILIRAIAGFFSTLGMVWIGRRVVYDLRTQMFQRLVRLPTQYYDDHSSVPVGWIGFRFIGLAGPRAGPVNSAFPRRRHRLGHSARD